MGVGASAFCMLKDDLLSKVDDGKETLLSSPIGPASLHLDQSCRKLHGVGWPVSSQDDTFEIILESLTLMSDVWKFKFPTNCMLVLMIRLPKDACSAPSSCTIHTVGHG